MTSQTASSNARLTFQLLAAVAVVGYMVATSLIIIPLSSPLGATLWLIASLIGGALVVVLTADTVRGRKKSASDLDRLFSELDAERNARYQVESSYRGLAVACDARTAALRHVEQEEFPALLQESAPPSPPDLNGDDLAPESLRRISGLSRQVGEHFLARISATERVLVALSRNVQTNAHRIQEQTTRALDRHPNDPDVLETCMQVDHAASQQARSAQTLAVLCGEEPGQQWRDPRPLEDIVRGAASRITAYERVEIRGDSGLSIAAQVVEPAVHLVAELLANATQLSPPTTTVPVAVRQMQRGAVIEIDDGGVGVNDTEIDELRGLASGRRFVRLADLGETPRTGLAVVGRYAQRHGFRIDLTHSVYGGVRAIVFIPDEYVVLTPAPAPERKPSAPADSGSLSTDVRPRDAVPRVPDSAPPAAEPTGTPRHDVLPDGLPRRRSRRGETPAAESGVEWPTGSSAETVVRSPEEEGQWMDAFINATPSTSTQPPKEDTEGA